MIRQYLLFPVRRMPQTTGTVASVAALGLVLGSGLLPIPCPFLLLTGLDCPFCGGSRTAGALLHGDLLGALDHNAFAVVVLAPLAGAVAVAMGRRELGRGQRSWPVGSRGRAATIGLLAALGLWWVLRNLPFAPFTALRA